MNYRAISGLSTGAVLITIGAILYFAVTANVDGFDVNAAGAILMIVGFMVGLVALLWGMTEGIRQERAFRGRPVGRAVPTAPQPSVQPPVSQQQVSQGRVVVQTRTVDDGPVY